MGVFEEEELALSGPVVVLDDVGHMEGLVVAQHLMEIGSDVTVVTRFDGMASRIAPDWSTWSARQHLARADVKIIGRSFVAEIGDGTATIGSLDGSSDTTIPANAVVHVTHHEPNSTLADQLATTADVIHTVGEARTHGFLTSAMQDGFELGMRL